MNVSIIIPARYASSRFPGKPLYPIRGCSLLERVYKIASAVQGVASVFVATDDERVADHARSFGAEAIMTSEKCKTGTDRVFEAVQAMKIKPDAVINLQGDAVLTPPWVVQALVDAHQKDSLLSMTTAATHCSWEQLEALRKHKIDNPTSGTTVTMNRNGMALYFSKAIIPYLRKADKATPPPVYRHIGIYGYRTDILEKLCALEQTPLESAEQLEQLRALENGIPIKVEIVDYKGRTHGSVDAPDDVVIAEAIIDSEGELVSD